MSDTDWSELERAAGPGAIRSPEPSLGTLWFSMQGRIPRSTYWLKFFAPILGLQILATLVDATLGTLPANGGAGPFTVVVVFALLYPGLAGAVKRLHDLAHPGWYIAVYYGGMIGMGVVLAIALPLLGEKALVLLIPGVILLLGSIWFALKMAFFRGTPGPNRYGPDPLRARWERMRA